MEGESELDQAMRNMRNTLSALHSLITRPEGNPPASQSAVAALPAVVVLLEDVESGAACCTVCNEVAEVGEEVVRLPCRHLYHGACIRQWLGVRNTCPMCRFELPTDDIGGQVVQSGAVKEVQLAQAGCSANASLERREAAESFGQLEGRTAGGATLDEEECFEGRQVAEGVWHAHPPKYGDYEAQRHWMEITLHLPAFSLVPQLTTQLLTPSSLSPSLFSSPSSSRPLSFS
ncbi:unnamed protein product, partial [Closterium sp. Naga37s-1]